MIKIGILYGGRSGEHDVSRCSAASVVKYLDRSMYEVIAIGIDHDGRWYVQDEPEFTENKSFGTVLKLNRNGSWLVNHFPRDGRLYFYNVNTGAERYVDVVFPAIHGTFCEDGTLQGLLELAMVPYVGADVMGSATGMDKDVAKRLLRDAGIPVVPWIKIGSDEWQASSENIRENILRNIGIPCFVKPCCAGSSVGISKVKNSSELLKAVETAFEWDVKILIEKAVNAREIEFAVIGNENPESSIAGEIRPKHEFYSYEAKYIDSDGAELLIPAEINGVLHDTMKKAAVDAYIALGCCGMSRIDFFLERDTNEFYLNEINTLPGFTSISMYPKLWERSGLEYPALLDRLIELAFERRKKKNMLRTEF